MALRTRTIAGIVTDGKNPVANGKVEFQLTKPLGYTTTHVAVNRAFQATTDSNGAFSISLWCDEDSLLPINYTVRFPVTDNGNPSASNVATISFSYEDGSTKNIGTLIAESTDAADIASEETLAELIDARIEAAGTGGGSGDSSKTLKFVCTDRTTPIAETDNLYSELITEDILLDEVVAYLTVRHASGTFTVDILRNGESILDTLLTIDATEISSLSAAIQAVIGKPHLLRGDEIVIAVTDDADGAASGLIIYLNGNTVPADTEEPTVPTDLALSINGDNFIEVAYTPSTDNYEVAGYKIRVNGGVYTDEVIDIGLANPYVLEYEGGADTYSIEIAAYDRANNLSAYSTAESIEAVFVAYWTIVNAKHEETPANGVKVLTTGESGFTSKTSVSLSADSYVEWIWSMDGNWDFYVGRAFVGDNNGGGYGLWYEGGSTTRVVTFTPTIGDVFRVKRIAGSNCEVYRNGTLIYTSSSGDFGGTIDIKIKTYTTSVNQTVAKPTVVNS